MHRRYTTAGYCGSKSGPLHQETNQASQILITNIQHLPHTDCPQIPTLSTKPYTTAGVYETTHPHWMSRSLFLFKPCSRDRVQYGERCLQSREHSSMLSSACYCLILLLHRQVEDYNIVDGDWLVATFHSSLPSVRIYTLGYR